MKGWFVAAWVLLACGAPQAASEAPSASSLAIVAVCPGGVPVDGDASGSAGLRNDVRDASAHWPASRFPGALFSVASDHGYLATVRMTTTMRECDHCSGPGVDVELVDGRWWEVGLCQFAVGPVKRPLRQMRVSDLHSEVITAHAVTPWREWLQIDLDGDGRSELAGVERCTNVEPSSCNDHLCDRICRGVRAAGAPDSQIRSIECQSYIPDIIDRECEPGER